jgi:hypothetical protein
MLKSEIVTFHCNGSGSLKDHEEIDMMKGMLSSLGLSGSDVDTKISWDLNGVVDEPRIECIAKKFTKLIVTIEPVKQESLFNMSEEYNQYGVVYDDEIDATYEENYEIVRNQFLMNSF